MAGKAAGLREAEELRSLGVDCGCGVVETLVTPFASFEHPHKVVVGYHPGCGWHGTERAVIYEQAH